MHNTRKAAANARTRARAAPAKGQSTISFSNKVTKAVPQDGKKDILAPAVAKVETPEAVAVKEEPEDVVADEEPEQSEQLEMAVRAKPREKTEMEMKAEAITDTQIKKYWKSIEAERRTPRVHQKDLSQSEMVLRYFDVSSQYGPCVGTPRLKRWERAERLGLQPPIEVLAVLLKEQEKGNSDFESAEIDKILNSSVVEA